MQKDANLVDLAKSSSIFIQVFPISFSMKSHHYNEYLVSKSGFDAVENEPRKVSITDLSDHVCRSHAKRLVAFPRSN